MGCVCAGIECNLGIINIVFKILFGRFTKF
jgi:hypothetical protein